ncbi:hypothetical protein LTR36_006000 [Oleoguttula mirabilis]|uniref:Uncharacterized protein n=1 Tax=Oleoguttula mirabilis TaxID=1507867 RepID=A0AAV9JDF7_9PEZI|nr:hypothetical protein LTR36_006000 [Oleoguttula mirabilis]
MSSRTRLSFTVKLNKLGETITIQITDPSGLQADNLALATWGSSEVLANVLHRIPIDFSHSDVLVSVLGVLELGAGTGLVGLSAACIWRTNATLTDLPPLIPAIYANAKLNGALLSQHGGVAAVGMLDWSRPEFIDFGGGGSSEGEGEGDAAAAATDPVAELKKGVLADPDSDLPLMKARVIVAADTVYDEAHPALLVQAIKARLDTRPEARLVMCYPLRIGYLDHIRDLWERLEEAGLICVQEGREKIDDSWDENTPYEWCVWRWQDVKELAQKGTS